MSVNNANFTGTIAIRGVDGKYLKVTPTNGLVRIRFFCPPSPLNCSPQEFGNQQLDDNAKFQVKQGSNSKIQLVGKRFEQFRGAQF